MGKQKYHRRSPAEFKVMTGLRTFSDEVLGFAEPLPLQGGSNYIGYWKTMCICNTYTDYIINYIHSIIVSTVNLVQLRLTTLFHVEKTHISFFPLPFFQHARPRFRSMLQILLELQGLNQREVLRRWKWWQNVLIFCQVILGGKIVVLIDVVYMVIKLEPVMLFVEPGWFFWEDCPTLDAGLRWGKLESVWLNEERLKKLLFSWDGKWLEGMGFGKEGRVDWELHNLILCSIPKGYERWYGTDIAIITGSKVNDGVAG